MIDTENMTFEEARLALVDDLKSSLENLRNRLQTSKLIGVSCKPVCIR